MRLLKQSTAVNILVFMTDSTDHVSGKTGLTLTITASKAGGAFSSITPTVTERTNGWYQLALTTSHTDTPGDFALHITGTGADPADIMMQVIVFDLAVATQNVNVDQINLNSNSAANLATWLAASSAGVTRGTGLIRRNTAQTGSTSSTIKLDTGANAADDVYNGAMVWISGGTGSEQAPRLITDYVGSTKVASVAPNWAVTPDNTTVFDILIHAGADVEMWRAVPGLDTPYLGAGGYVPGASVQLWNGLTVPELITGANGGMLPSADVITAGTAAAGAATTITLGTAITGLATSTTDNTYNGSRIVVTSSTGQSQERIITGYVGATKVATVDSAWVTNPGSGSKYVILAGGRNVSDVAAPTASANASAVWEEARSGHTTAGSFGEYVLADVVKVSGDATAADNLELQFDTTGLTGAAFPARQDQINTTTIADAVWDADRLDHVIAGSFGEGVVVSSLLTAAMEAIRDTIMNYAHDTGLTIRGAFRRLDAVLAGKATGLKGATAKFFRRDGVTVAVQAAQDTVGGARSAANVTGSES